MPSRIGMGSKLPMQPLSLGVRPGREDLMFQVTKRGLDDGSQRPGAPQGMLRRRTTCGLGKRVGRAYCL